MIRWNTFQLLICPHFFLKRKLLKKGKFFEKYRGIMQFASVESFPFFIERIRGSSTTLKRFYQLLNLIAKLSESFYRLRVDGAFVQISR